LKLRRALDCTCNSSGQCTSSVKALAHVGQGEAGPSPSQGAKRVRHSAPCQRPRQPSPSCSIDASFNSDATFGPSLMDAGARSGPSATGGRNGSERRKNRLYGGCQGDKRPFRLIRAHPEAFGFTLNVSQRRGEHQPFVSSPTHRDCGSLRALLFPSSDSSRAYERLISALALDLTLILAPSAAGDGAVSLRASFRCEIDGGCDLWARDRSGGALGSQRSLRVCL
jgi:hypothetical protein